MRLASLTRLVLLLAVALVGVLVVRDIGRRHPERLPWTPLSLARPIGPFTGPKLAGLAEDPALCRGLLANAGVAFTSVPAVGALPNAAPNAAPADGPARCGYADGVRITPGRNAIWRPAAPKIACPVAAALHLWERDIVGPAARRHFGRPLTGIDHLGSFNCRRIAGSGNWSEHATADAIDVAGFRIGGGLRVSVLADWNGTPEKAAFLREVRTGACRLFATTLSPDYNAAHADHLHLDQAARGMMGGTVCR